MKYKDKKITFWMGHYDGYNGFKNDRQVDATHLDEYLEGHQSGLDMSRQCLEISEKCGLPLHNPYVVFAEAIDRWHKELFPETLR